MGGKFFTMAVTLCTVGIISLLWQSLFVLRRELLHHRSLFLDCGKSSCTTGHIFWIEGNKSLLRESLFVLGKNFFITGNTFCTGHFLYGSRSLCCGTSSLWESFLYWGESCFSTAVIFCTGARARAFLESLSAPGEEFVYYRSHVWSCRKDFFSTGVTFCSSGRVSLLWLLRSVLAQECLCY